MSLRMQMEKKKAQEEMRRLMTERKKKDVKPTNIDNPLAKYNNLGQLMCLLCSSVVRSENVWQVHLNSKQHKENVEKAKKLKELTNNFTEGKKIKRTSTLSPTEPPEKKLKSILKNSGDVTAVQIPKTNIPNVVSFHDEEIKRAPLKLDLIQPTRGDDAGEQSDVNAKDKDSKTPLVRNIEYKDPVEEEWEKFQKEIKEEASAVLDLELKKEDTKKNKQDVEQFNEDEDEIQVDLTCEVLKLCFEKFEVGDIIRQYTVAQLVSDKDVGVANKAIMITSNLPNDAYPKILDEMRIALEYDSSSKCNAFEVIVNISSRSPELLQLSAEHGYLDKLVSELDTDDVLYHLNILELMTRLATTQQGINHIVKHGALKKVGELVTDLPNNPLCGLTTPGYMKFFGVIAHKYPQEIFTKYPVLLNLMFDTIDSQDQATLPIALDTLAFVGSTIEGKLSLAALGSQYTQAVGKVAQMITTGTSDIKVRALHCFASLVGVDTGTDAPKTRPIDHRVTLMTREWFRTLSVQPGPMEVLVEICKNPFPDIRSAGFSLLDAVCQHQWGEELVARTAGFVEFLLDRSVSFTKELKESKYDIVKRLSHSLAFDNNTVLRLQLYVEQGPFYSETEMQVATEEGD
ncbi:hypothetical protein MSG28_002875 [Choristoneura fumiferana]|uniref:Uncharacterized protein n=1 Tax=Choristoneura fumiferana TaxID=7141 RepID=A0ACC0JJK1_CHOFU|nr:hypothetical protein MSG28_002875 [Choristoneura fumiferana]